MSTKFQISIQLPKKEQGFHLITDEIMQQLTSLPEHGIMHVFIKHTSAGLTLNENACPDVRVDFHHYIQKLVPESSSDYLHTDEGDDDMPAHIKASLIGHSVSIPIANHSLSLGIWQGIYLGEFRKHAGARQLIISIIEL
ncbi:MAG: secondary thiamine-phosphate synthase enzyme YjbQ [Bacteroidota bacterium]|nr:secondary thiamine-phosphate synthase enzyme YjbQ [Bacteroidota bacterium]